jgi:hypothetical protein
MPVGGVIPQGRAPVKCNDVCRMVSQVIISWQAYVFIRPKSLDAKVSGPNFCICNYEDY